MDNVNVAGEIRKKQKTNKNTKIYKQRNSVNRLPI